MTEPRRASVFFDRRSIRHPLAWLIVVVVIVGISLALLSNALILLDNVRSDIRRSLTAAANAAGSAGSAAVVFQDANAARAELRLLEAYPEIKAAALYTPEGARLASYGDTRLSPDRMRETPPVNEDILPLADTAILHLPILVDDAPVGTVYVQARLDTYWQTYLSSVAITFMVAISAGLLALILAMRFLSRIILPVRMLAEAASDARLRQDFSPRRIPAADNEIGDLVHNFNDLLAEVEAGRKAQQLQQVVLEQQVAERTAELLAAKEAADAANAAKSRFLAAASHDLRQPIHAMRLFQDALAATPLNGEQRRINDYLTLSTRNLTEILNTLLDVSRLDGCTVIPHPGIVPAYDLLRKIEAEFAPLALAKGLRFQFFFPRHELMLYTDAHLLYSLLRNFIDNAIKYTDHGGVLIGLRRRRDSVLIQVWDTGIGIAPEHVDAVFDEYFQVDNPQRDRTKGLGLGLVIAKRVEGILGTRIGCRSRLGKGSKFEVCVPLAPESKLGAPSPTAQPRAEDERPAASAVKHVAVIEDDVMASKALELSLGAYGVEVSLFASAEQALSDQRIEHADVYVVDYRLPGLNGIQLLGHIEKRIGRPVKALLLTGETHIEDTPAALVPRWKLLSKPIDSATLMREITARYDAQ